jgi:tetratricopeptide (TPR) repeat protein
VPAVVRFTTRPREVSVQRLDVPPIVAQLVMQCVEVDPAARPHSADEIVKKLDAAMSATPLAPVGDDPSVTRKAFAWYALAFVVATGLARVAMIGLGLPDWVFPGAMLLMALGLPVVTTAALTRRAAFQSSLERHAEVSRVGWLFTPGPMTVRLAQALTWRRVLAGGGMSLGAFGILVAGFMVSRSLGLGPAGSLLAKGQMLRNQSIILADFTSAPADSSLTHVFAEVFSLGLKESNVVDVMTPAAVAEALRRMRRDPKEPLTLDVARELAQRDGIRAVATGELVREGPRVQLRVRLIAPDSGTVLTVKEASTTSADLIAGVDQLTRSLRSTIGESLKRVRQMPPLERATTSSFEALRLYTSAVRAHDLEGDAAKAWALLARAVEIDSTFAAAWRKLSVVWHVKPTVYTEGDAMEAAFRHRASATEGERLSIEGGAYFRRGDRLRSIAAYEEFAVRTGRPHNNLAWNLVAMREFARAESLYRVMFAQGSTGQQPYHGLTWALMNQGKHREADSVARVFHSRFPNESWIVSIRCGMRDFATCEFNLDSVRKANPRQVQSVRQLAELALMRGQLDRWEQLDREASLIAAGLRPDTTGLTQQRNAWIDLMVRKSPAAALARLDSVKRPIALVPARLYVLANRPDSARGVIAARDSARGANPAGPDLNQAKAALAVADGKYDDAVRLYRLGDRVVDGTSHRNICTNCLFLDLASVFESSNQPDSAIAYYERFLATPLYNPGPNQGAAWQSRLQMFWWTYVNEAWVHERLGALYDATGNRANAVTHLESFVALWKDADPELQLRVSAARNRLAQLKAS